MLHTPYPITAKSAEIPIIAGTTNGDPDAPSNDRLTRNSSFSKFKSIKNSIFCKNYFLIKSEDQRNLGLVFK